MSAEKTAQSLKEEIFFQESTICFNGIVRDIENIMDFDPRSHRPQKGFEEPLQFWNVIVSFIKIYPVWEFKPRAGSGGCSPQRVVPASGGSSRSTWFGCWSRLVLASLSVLMRPTGCVSTSRSRSEAWSFGESFVELSFVDAKRVVFDGNSAMLGVA